MIPMCFDRPRRFSRSVRVPPPPVITSGLLQSSSNPSMVSIAGVMAGGKKGCGCGGR